ncbi:MAG: metallophosphoesterase [Bacteroidota bacterium]
MSNRRVFIKGSLAGLTLAGLSPLNDAFSASSLSNFETEVPKGNRLRFAIASDGHYGQPGTEFKKYHQEMVSWLNEAHQVQPLDFVIFNGDLVHDKPDLLPELKRDYFEQLKFPFYAIPGNHDHADASIWRAVFGYEDNYSFQKNGVGFVLANTSNTKGTYLCPDTTFLKRELDKLSILHTVFVVLHIPPHFWVPESPFVECADTLKLLHSYANVKAVFHGHDHSLDSVFYTNKLPHFFDSHIGGNWGTTYRGYRIVEISDEYKINTFQVNASREPKLNETKL